MPALTLDTFRSIAGSDNSIGYIGQITNRSGDVRLTKLAAHRHFTSLNTREMATATEETTTNGRLREAFFSRLVQSLESMTSRLSLTGGEGDDRFRGFISYASQVLGRGDAGILAKPLERRVVRDLLAMRDALAGDQPAKLSRSDAAVVRFLESPKPETCTFSPADAQNLFTALKAVKEGSTGNYGVNIKGRALQLLKTPRGDIHVRMPKGFVNLGSFGELDSCLEILESRLSRGSHVRIYA